MRSEPAVGVDSSVSRRRKSKAILRVQQSRDSAVGLARVFLKAYDSGTSKMSRVGWHLLAELLSRLESAAQRESGRDTREEVGFLEPCTGQGVAQHA